MSPGLLNPRNRSLLRGTVLVLGGLALSFSLADFPNDRKTLALLIPAVLGALGTADTWRCLGRRWNLYHGAVFLLLSMDIMALSLIFFFLLYPYGRWFL